MATKQLSNKTLQRALTEEAWMDLARFYEWTESMLEKHQDELDWNCISENENIHWTIPMIKKFQDKINWESFSENIDPESLTEELIEAFQDKWDWNKLSELNYNFCKNVPKLLDKFGEKWNWRLIINNSWYSAFFEDDAIGFYERYKKYIPEYLLYESSLWSEMVLQRKDQLLKEIKKSKKKDIKQ